jgi:hypothetical protein
LLWARKCTPQREIHSRCDIMIDLAFVYNDVPKFLLAAVLNLDHYMQLITCWVTGHQPVEAPDRRYISEFASLVIKLYVLHALADIQFHCFAVQGCSSMVKHPCLVTAVLQCS